MRIVIDPAKTAGSIKPMNCVNNGPVPGNVRMPGHTNFEDYKALEIPFARNHDASFSNAYGGEHTVDVHRIFKNFDADENDPASYFFEGTDGYVRLTQQAGTNVFYRLGASIEHGIKYGTRVPKDFGKWARICEHIIRHYNEGWADGFTCGIRYWEIWNEPDCRNHDGSNPCWQGTDGQFIDLYCTAAKHLKACFPDLHIGGPAFCTLWSGDFNGRFLDRVAKDGIPLDFYSYHWYGKRIEDFAETVRRGRDQLDSRGLTKTEAILNEWNYIRGWLNEDWAYSLRSEQGLKGSSFVAAAMCAGQALPLDMLMYYDARPCAMNGIFAENLTRLKGYYTFAAFRDLKKLGSWIPTGNGEDGVWSCAATDGKTTAVMLTHYDENDDAAPATACIDFMNAGENKKASVYCIDENHDLAPVSEEYFTSGRFTVRLSLPVFTTVLVKLEEM